MATPAIVEDGAADQDGSWRTATREAPGPGLDDVVIRYCGYEERFAASVRRREVPHGGVVLILSFGEPIDVGFLTGRAELGRHRSFVAGLSDTAAVTQHGGRQHGVQVDLTPLGAHRLLGLPMSDRGPMRLRGPQSPDPGLPGLGRPHAHDVALVGRAGDPRPGRPRLSVPIRPRRRERVIVTFVA